MWSKEVRFILSIILISANVSSVLACELNSLSIQSTNTKSEYSVFNTSNFAIINTYLISANIAGEECKHDLILQLNDKSTSLKSNNQEKLNFQWSGQTGMSISNQWHLSLTESQPTATVQMRFPSNQWLTSGTYQGLLEVSTMLPSEYDLIQSSPKSLKVIVVVPPAAKIHYYGVSQKHYDLELGELYSNKVINSSPMLWVQSNTDFTVGMRSTHQGNLRHESNDAKWDIPYQLTMNNDQVDLKQVEGYIKHKTATSGQKIQLEFVIGSTKRKPGGDYEDTLEISIEPDLSQQPFF